MTHTTNVEIIETAHGPVSYETAECANCGELMRAEDAVTVGAGFVKYTCTGRNICDATHTKPTHRTTLCEYCAENTLGYVDGGRGRFKGTVIKASNWATKDLFNTMIVAMVFGMAVVIVLLIAGALA